MYMSENCDLCDTAQKWSFYRLLSSEVFVCGQMHLKVE